MGNSPTISVSVIEDDEVIRRQLATLLTAAGGLRCVSQHASAEAAFRELPASAPQVVLVDINLPGLSGIDGVRRLKPMMPKTQFVMLTVHEDSDTIFESLLAGATGYLVKSTPAPQLVEAIHEVVRGGSPMSSGIARKVVQFVAAQHHRRPSVDLLTDREREVLTLLAKGGAYKQIAADLSIHIDTVRNHIRSIYDKLQVHSRTEAVVKYFKV